MKGFKKPLALLLALLMMFAAGCAKEPEPVEVEPEPEPVVEQTVFINGLPIIEMKPGRFPRYVKQVLEKHEQNSDTVGWLELPGTHINDVVVCNNDPNDYNRYYERRDFQKQYSFNGIFYADFRNKFGEGGAEELSDNTVIYGHTMSEDYDGVMMAPVFKFTDEEFAKKTPYIYFSTTKEDLIWEVFAVFYSAVQFAYNTPNQTPEQFGALIDEAKAKSIYNYDATLSPEKDKILTLSTCTYRVPGVEGKLGYPNKYRYVVMAKLVDKKDASKTEAAFTKNPSPKAA